MKFRGAIIVGVILIFSGLMVISPAIAAPNENANDRAKSGPVVSIPENAVQISDHVYYLGKSKDVDGTVVEGARPCKICTRLIINAGITTVKVLDKGDSVETYEVADFIKNEEIDLNKADGY